MREVIATGKTVEEATEAGCAQLGLSRGDVSVEILELPAKKLFKTTPARVKVTAADGEAPAAAETAAPAAQPVAAAQPAGDKPQPEKPKAEQYQPKAEGKAVLQAEPEEEIDLAANARAKQAVNYLNSIFTAMGETGAKITAFKQGDATLLRVEGESVGDKIEIRGEVIQALSYLIDRAVNAGVDKKEEDYLRVRLDIAGYRNRRETELVALAQRTGKEVAKTARSRTLAPMNPYERLIIHTAISAMEGVTSESIGSDTERRVVVKSLAPNATDGEDWRPPRSGGGGGNRGGQRRERDRDRGGYGGNSRDRGPRGPRGGGGGNRGERAPRSSAPEREYANKERSPGAAPVVPERREAIRDGEDLPLYGKIEI